ncbi:unnamed protein product, partial [Symbiodinium microadriaticum]
MRRERFLYCFQYGHSLLSTALEREGVQSAFAEGIDDTESIETVRGQDLCLTMCSRILPGGLLYLMLSRHCYASQGVKEQVAGFLGNLVLLADMIAVRCVVHLPMQESRFFEMHPALE